MLTRRAYPFFLLLYPPVVLIPTFRTDNPALFPYGAKFPLARGFIWIPIGKFYQFHALYVLPKGIDYTGSIKDF
jgi:hypothetical protein